MTVTYSVLKERLSNIFEIYNDIQKQTERLEVHREKMESPRSAKLTGMPGNPSPQTEHMTDMVYKANRMEERIDRMQKKYDAEIDWCEGILNHLKCAQEKSIIRLRYLDGEHWNDIIFSEFGDEPDFLENEDCYARKAYRIHGRALEHMAIEATKHNLW